MCAEQTWLMDSYFHSVHKLNSHISILYHYTCCHFQPNLGRNGITVCHMFAIFVSTPQIQIRRMYVTYLLTNCRGKQRKVITMLPAAFYIIRTSHITSKLKQKTSISALCNSLYTKQKNKGHF